jgi:hypothetical protein
MFVIFRPPHRGADGNWRVPDIYISAWLLALGHSVMSIEADEGKDGRWYFVFEATISFSRDYESFTRGEKIGIRRYLDAVYDLKSRVGDLRK